METSVISIKKVFNSLSNTQKKQIESCMTPELYYILEAAIRTSVDVGDGDLISPPFAERVHNETFSNNMVDLLCNCKSYVDIISALNKLRTNTDLHGKDKIQELVFGSSDVFGAASITIDGYGNITHKLSEEAAQLEKNINDCLTSGIGAEEKEIIAVFYGDITANVLNVHTVLSGNIILSPSCIIEGHDVNRNTYIKYNATKKNGPNTYFVSNTSTTNPNTLMVLSNTKPAKTSSGGGGGGGFGMPLGMFPGLNFFEDAAKELSEMIPRLSPDAGARASKIMGMSGNLPGNRNQKIQNALGQFPQVPQSGPSAGIMSLLSSATSLASAFSSIAAIGAASDSSLSNTVLDFKTVTGDYSNVRNWVS